MYYQNVNYLRGIAALIVVYSHLVGNYLDLTGVKFFAHSLIVEYIINPFHIVGNGGWFGVCLFFFTSGFVITNSAFKESTLNFLKRRLLRIYVPLIPIILALWSAKTMLKSEYWGSDNAGGIGNLFANLTLYNFLAPGFQPILDVAWSLAIEVIFYILMSTQIWLIKKQPIAIPWILLSIIVMGSWISNEIFGARELAGNLAAFPLLLIGQAIYYRKTHLSSNKHFSAMILVFWLTFQLLQVQAGTVVGDQTKSYFLNAMLALIVFSAVVATNKSGTKKRPILQYFASRSYSIYLVHGTIGLSLLLALRNLFYWQALLIALVAVFIATELTYRLLERPSIAWGKKISS